MAKPNRHPRPFHVIARPQQEQERNAFAVKIPALLGIPHALFRHAGSGAEKSDGGCSSRLQRGRKAWLLMQEIAKGNRTPQVLNAFHAVEKDLGYGILLANYAPDMNHVTPEQYQAAQRGAIPQSSTGILEFSHHDYMRFTSAAGDGDCADTDLTLAYRPASLGTAHDAVELAATVDCH